MRYRDQPTIEVTQRVRCDVGTAWELVAEVENERRWVWNVVGTNGVSATWAFEVEPASEGVLIRQWARMGPAPSGLSVAIAASPGKEARIVARRLSEWQRNMQANLEFIRWQAEG
ncbi:MAG: hypothetical protein QOE41_2193 [Mycobacterium sp.]|nr:Polyketide cyclase / dehydrase and lipid transport [Mycobacterium sp.]MDT5132882.1 hypothetical protein [Mycobacterium sp.]